MTEDEWVAEALASRPQNLTPAQAARLALIFEPDRDPDRGDSQGRRMPGDITQEQWLAVRKLFLRAAEAE